MQEGKPGGWPLTRHDVSHLLGKATDTAQVHRLILDAAVPAGQQTGAGYMCS